VISHDVVRRLSGAATLVLLAAGGTACASAAEPTVAATATSFASAMARHDGVTACDLLTDAARRDAETFGRSCATELATLPDPGDVQQVDVWGDAAQARLAGDTLFLLQSPDGWRVSAAGCTPQGEAPYQCEVQG
jgi:hypothetical protein